MKKICKATVYTLCSLCLTFSIFMHYYGTSFVFFGEPEYPTDEN